MMDKILRVTLSRVYEYTSSSLEEELREKGEDLSFKKVEDLAIKKAYEDMGAEMDFFSENPEDFASYKVDIKYVLMT